jgi:2-dehydro-3-deoxyphosphogluconate aldolase / (4S)-4-hydroxy-2-oxoglutarate aldolase
MYESHAYPPSLNSWLQLLQQYRAIAIVRSSSTEIAQAMAFAVASGGMRLIEVTWNSDRAADTIAKLRSQLPDCLIGTGTILTVAQLREAISCGIQFCFTPHVDPQLIQEAIAADIPIVAGALSPTEIVTAWQAGASCVKVFPADAIGGVNYIKSLQGPLDRIPLVPTGGITIDNACRYIEAGAIAVGLAGHLFPKSSIAANDWDAIAMSAKVLQQKLLKSFSEENYHRVASDRDNRSL